MNGDSTASTSSATVDDVDELLDPGQEDVTLSALLQRTIAASEGLLESGDWSLPATQAALTSTLADLSLCQSLVAHLALLSSNETVEELSTSTLRCFLVPFYAGMLELQRRTRDYKARIEVLNAANVAFDRFIRSCNQYEVVGREKRKRLSLLEDRQAAMAGDQAQRREAKIAQFKEERALKGQIDELNQRLQARPSSSIAAGSVNASQEDIEDEYLRPLLLLSLELHYINAHNELSSTAQELELLSNVPNMSELPDARARQHKQGALEQDARERSRETQDSTWRLDAPLQSAGGHPHRQLVDSSGRVLRPFTILPSANGGLVSGNELDTRLRLQGEVFGSSHRLPTMSIDEYLDMEYERGNVLKGGGARNAEEAKLEGDEKRAWEEEEDNAGGYEREEAGLEKKRGWDDYKDTHKKGDGNRMNRG